MMVLDDNYFGPPAPAAAGPGAPAPQQGPHRAHGPSVDWVRKMGPDHPKVYLGLQPFEIQWSAMAEADEMPTRTLLDRA